MFLTDQQILDLIKTGGIVNGPPPLQDPFSKESRVQPCSIDLTIGSIYVPSTHLNKPGDVPTAGSIHSLEPGQTVVVETAEEFHLPGDIAGFGFPPARVSSNGILMTDPGHVDPGYDGKIHLTIVNMGRVAYPLKSGDPVCTVMLFRLGGPPVRDYRQRGPYPAWSSKELLDRLSPDFVEVTNRATKVAEDVVQKAQLWQMWVPIIVAIISGVAAIVLNVFVLQADLKRDIGVLQTQVEVLPLKERVEVIEKGMMFEDRLIEIERRLEVQEKARSP